MAARIKAPRLGHMSRPSVSFSATGLSTFRIFLKIAMINSLVGGFAGEVGGRGGIWGLGCRTETQKVVAEAEGEIPPVARGTVIL